MSVSPLKDYLQHALKRAGVDEQVEASQVLEKTAAIFRALFGEDAERRMKPLYVKRGVLTVSCTSSVAAQELKLHERDIMQKLTQTFGKDVVTRLRFFA